MATNQSFLSFGAKCGGLVSTLALLAFALLRCQTPTAADCSKKGLVFNAGSESCTETAATCQKKGKVFSAKTKKCKLQTKRKPHPNPPVEPENPVDEGDVVADDLDAGEMN
jgi:hypothetical protein